MAYTQKQWNDFQATLPVEERTSYLDYLKETDLGAYNKFVNKILENLKTAEVNSSATLTEIVDEQTKRAAMKTDTAAQKAAVAAKAEATRIALAKLTSGKTLNDTEKGLLGISVTTPKTTSAPTTTSAPAKKTLTNAELQTIVAKLAKGQQLTDEEAASINAPTPTTTGGTPTPTPSVTSNLIPTPTPTVTVTVGGTPAPTPAVTPAPTFTKPNNDAVLIPDGTSAVTPIPTTTGNTPTPTPTLTGNTPTPTPTLTGITPTPIVTGITPTPIVTGTTPIPMGTTPIPTGTTPIPTGTTAAPGGLTYKATDGTVFTDQAAFTAYQKILTDAAAAKNATAAASAAERQSAYDLLYAQFSAYGLGSLVEPLRGLIQSGSSPAEFTIKLRESEPYKKRFSANQQRVSKGLKAIGEAEYLGLEDQYQNILRNAGLPESYWKRGDLGVQEGFTNFIANDVSAVELEDRVSTAQQRLIYANPEVSIALKNFYPDISNGDLLAYALDPTKGLEQIKRRITAAEIGSSAVQLGLTTNVTDAEYLARYGVNKAQAQQGYRTAAEILPTASKLGDIYSKQGLGAYTQQTAEQEIFNVPGAAEAAAKRRKLSELEQASFSGRAGMGALARERAGAF